jgi:hypothetical protein
LRNNFNHHIHGKYILFYKKNSIDQEIVGTFELDDNQDTVYKEIDPGTCSGTECVYPDEIADGKLTVQLTTEENETMEITQDINTVE